MTAVALGSRAPSRAAPDAACPDCLRRAWLLARLVGRLEIARRGRHADLRLALALPDGELMSALGAPPEIRAEHRSFSVAAARARCRQADLSAFCRHHDGYPAVLRELPDAPAVVHVAGDRRRFLELTASERTATAVVGARRASAYGLEVARVLGRGLAAADVVVVSGLALGIDAAAHAGAVEVGGPTLAVLAGGADVPYPRSKRRLYAQVRAHGCVISELPPGAEARPWCFPARNRLIAALAGLTVVVEAAERSGSLITAELARDLGRDVGAVPGRVTSPLSAGANALLRDGAAVVRGAEDALDLACGVGAWEPRPAREQVPSHLRALLEAVARGSDTLELLVDAGHPVGIAMAGLAELELLGHLRATVGGRYVVSA